MLFSAPKSTKFSLCLLLGVLLIFAADSRAMELSSSDTVFPHIAAGGEWTTSVTLVNTTNSTLYYTLIFYTDDGNQWQVSLAQDLSNHTGALQGALAPYASKTWDAFLGGPEIQTGWAQLINSSPGIAGYAVFRRNSNITATKQSAIASDWEAAVPITSGTSDHFIMAFDNTVVINPPPQRPTVPLSTGFAIVNTDERNTCTVGVVARNENGTRLGSASFKLLPKQHKSFMLDDTTAPLAKLITPTAGKRGTFEFIITNGYAAALGLRVSTTLAITSIQTFPLEQQ